MISYIDLGYRARLGNWLFQYAYLRSIAQRLKVTFYCPQWHGDKIFELNDQQERALYPQDIRQNSYFLHNCGFDPLALKIEDNTNVKGYFQSEKYFDRQAVLDWYTFNENQISRVKKKYQGINFHEATGLHLRFGDKKFLPQYVIHRESYYIKALKLVKKKRHILVFSDEPNHAKQHLKNIPNLTFIENNEAYEDLYLMSCCHDFISSSSTISWWGAWLNQHSEKTIIAPKEWFRPGFHLSRYNLSSTEWIQLKTCIPIWDNYHITSWRQQGNINIDPIWPIKKARRAIRSLRLKISNRQRITNPVTTESQLQPSENIAILFIGTGKYINYFPQFYTSSKHLFLPKTEKTYFVFTDDITSECLSNKENVVPVKIRNEQWPFSTLLRFRYINTIAQQLAKFSHIIYIDADMYTCANVLETEFFAHDKELFGVQHPGYIHQQGAFEQNEKSRACVTPSDDLSTYWQGCFWGGQANTVLTMSAELANRIDQDLACDIIAKWHDESHLNKYFIEHRQNVHTYHPGYAYPEVLGNQLNYDKKFIHLIKDKKAMRSNDNSQ